jgi:heme iron utilization protein
MTEKKALLRPTDEAAIAQARMLVRSAPFGSLSVLEPETGHPSISRVLLATDYDGVPVILVSRLASHTKALLADPRCALMVGEPGKGDPLASPRLMIRCMAEQIDRNHAHYQTLRARFVRHQPKSKLYVDFADFLFFKLNFLDALLNGGFGKAFAIASADLAIQAPLDALLAQNESALLDNFIKSGFQPKIFTKKSTDRAKSAWIPCGIDVAGLDFRQADKRLRVEFTNKINTIEMLNTLLDSPHLLKILI